VERDVEKVFGYSLSVSVVAPSERRKPKPHEFSAAERKTSRLSKCLFPSPPALRSVCNKGRGIGTGSLLGEIR
jgi:hypothetical protein